MLHDNNIKNAKLLFPEDVNDPFRTGYDKKNNFDYGQKGPADPRLSFRCSSEKNIIFFINVQRLDCEIVRNAVLNLKIAQMNLSGFTTSRFILIFNEFFVRFFQVEVLVLSYRHQKT